MLDPIRTETRGAKLGSRAGIAKKKEADYSTSSRAIKERERKSLLSEEQLQVERALARDRQARRQAKKKILASVEYEALDEAGRKAFLEQKLRTLDNIRNDKGISGTFSYG